VETRTKAKCTDGWECGKGKWNLVEYVELQGFFDDLLRAREFAREDGAAVGNRDSRVFVKSEIWRNMRNGGAF